MIASLNDCQLKSINEAIYIALTVTGGGNGGCPPKIFSGGTSPLKLQGGRKIKREKSKERKEKSRKIAKLSIGSKQIDQN